MIAEQKRKLKALGILEKIKSHEKYEVMMNYSACVALRDKLVATGEDLDTLIASTEMEIDQALKHSKFSPDILSFKNDFLVQLCSLREKNTKEIDTLDESLKELVSALLKADAQQRMVGEKFRHQLDALRTDLIKMCESD